MSAKETYRKFGQDLETLTALCWCSCQVVSVPAAEVRAGRTTTCGRALCTALDWHHALTADGSPCGCREREAG